MHYGKTRASEEAGFGLLPIIGFLLVIAIVISVAYIIGVKKSPGQQEKIINPSIEQKTEASQTPSTPQALVQTVYGTGGGRTTGDLASTKSGLEIYGTGLNKASYFSSSEYANIVLQNKSGANLPYCVDGGPWSSITATTTSSGDNVATVQVVETPVTPLPSPDPATIDITVTTTVHPLQITNIACPGISIKPAG